MLDFNPFNRNKKDEKKICRKTRKGWKCKDEVFIDEANNRTWNYCIKDGCWMCSNEIQKSKGGGQQIPNTRSFLCHRTECKETANKNVDKINEIINENKNLAETLFKGDFYLASDFALKNLISDLEKIEIEGIMYNFQAEPVIGPQFLQVIENTINSKPEAILSPIEKEILNSGYIKAGKSGGKIKNINSEKLAAYFSILAGRVKKRDQKQKAQNLEQTRKDFIENLKKLEGWNDLLTDYQRQHFTDEIKRLASWQFSVVEKQIKETIQKAKKMNDKDIERERERETKTPQPPTTERAEGQFRPTRSHS